MSVLIKGMELPENCVKCAFTDEYGDCSCKNDEPYYCDFTLKSRPDWCPLIEIPPHGRLIDADIVAQCLQEMSEDIERSFPYLNKNDALMIERGIAFARQCVLNLAPTIIEAEDG